MKVNVEQRMPELYKELEALVSEMNYTVAAVVVEGQHDKKTLNLLGYKNPIILCSKLSHNKIAGLIAKFSNVVILTDFDEQGNKLNKKLTEIFETMGIKVDIFYRRRFLKLLREARIYTIEGIYNIKLKLFPFSSN